MINKNSLFYTLLLFAALSSTSCSDDEKDNGLPKESPVVLIGEAFSLDSGDGETWNSSQKVGVFMVESGTTDIIKNYSNWEYIADNRSQTGYLVPANNEAMYLPNDGTKADIIAYYPYSKDETLTRAEITNYQYKLDLSDQSKTKADAFLYSRNAKGLNKDNPKTTVQLKPVLSKVKFNFAPATDMSEDNLKKIKARLTDMSTVANYDLLNGQFLFSTQTEEDKKIELKTTGDGSQAEGIIFPGTVTQNSELEVDIPVEGTGETKTLSCKLNESIESLDENIQYDILVEVGANSIKATITGKAPIYIQDWKDDDTVDGNADITIPDLIQTGDMESLTAADIKTGTSSPKDINIWYGVNNKVTGAVDLQTDAQQGNVLHMNFSGTLNWANNYIGYNTNGAKAANYRLTFKAKAGVTNTAALQVYIRINKSGTYFFVRKDADLTKACAAEVVKPSSEWKTYSVDFDLTQVVNTIWSKGIISGAVEADYENFYIAFATQTSGADFYIDDVSLKQIK